MTTAVYCTFEFEALHCWPACPFEDVAFLRAPHRHLFKVKAYRVVRRDRGTEFIRLKRAMQAFCAKYNGDLGSTSCEALAKTLIEAFDLTMCEVSEDGENGAVVSR